MKMERLNRDGRTRSTDEPDALDRLLHATYLDAARAKHEPIPQEWLDLLRAPATRPPSGSSE